MGRFIPKEELKRLTIGSHECFISEVKLAVAAGKQRLFGDDVAVEILASFNDKALLLVDHSRVAKVTLRRAGDGSISLGESRDLPVKSYDQPSTYLSEKLEDAAVGFLAGNIEEAKKALRGAAELTETVAFFSTEPTLQSITADRPWKKLFNQKEGEITKAAGEFESPEFEEKFNHILKFGFAGLHHENYKALILKDFSHLIDEVSTLSENVRSSTDSIKGATPGVDSDMDMVTSFTSFATDLEYDLTQHSKSLKVALEHNASIEEMAKLYDALASQWSAYTTAAHFVDRLATDLCGGDRA